MQPEIIVAIVTGLATVIAALIGVYSKSRKKDDAESTVSAKLKSPPTSSSAERSRFWDALSDTVLVVFGAEYTESANDHPKLSLRDLKAAEIILTFLARRYPEKRVASLPALTHGWQILLQDDTDLIIVAGFAVNVEFARHRSVLQQNFRLKLGRLCRPEGRRVYHVGLSGLSPDKEESLRRQPQAIEDLSSEFVSRDFALVRNARGHIYGSDRRVVALAGIKGNGTLGAAMHLTRDGRDTSQPDAILETPLGANDSLELVIQTDVVNGTVDTTRIVEAVLNGTSILDNSAGLWVSCELDQFCEECAFGEDTLDKRHDIEPFSQEPESREAARIAAIVFDLDDTLVDTFSMLITPLEVDAARRAVQKSRALPDSDELAALLLEIGRTNPAKLEQELIRQVPDAVDEILEARQEALNDLVLERLCIDPQVKLLLRELSGDYSLYLLTEGDSEFQNAKIDHLGIRAFFNEVKTASPGPEGKQKAITSLLEEYHYAPSSVLIVGNRLDKEIYTGNKLGMTTVWVRHGEGCAMCPGKDTGLSEPDYTVPNHTVENVLELREILDRPHQ